MGKSHITLPVSDYQAGFLFTSLVFTSLQHGAMCLRVQQASTLHSKKLLSPPLTAASIISAKQRSSSLKQICQHILRPQQIIEAGWWIQGLLLQCCFTDSSSLCLIVLTRLLIAASVHMSCGGEWVRPMGYTIISCLPGRYRKRPDTHLQTRRVEDYTQPP